MSPPPPLPGGFKLGEMIYFTGPCTTFSSGNRLVHGQQGEVTGPGTGECTDCVEVLFPSNKDDHHPIICSISHGLQNSLAHLKASRCYFKGFFRYLALLNCFKVQKFNYFPALGVFLEAIF